ncbi:CPBP family intramembrane glutamic endopeptidase [Bythopirellula polymerisocia]|uniref:CAAX amino terminal protease self-immunity n=1 Tax=Bythopirellula polymerisocia TaxID=2528003 RepID=A0A5C6BZP0_9BACT|nr:CPBP family intramembrane glutamic endopeptidase [Bythopirellula polymerisocia]TWU17830.1 CAAX amino terminal protease self- immunity [Bythopirellula polymerisocia]
MASTKAQTVATAMLFETGLGFLGVLVAWLGSISLQQRLSLSLDAVLRGLIASLPMIVLLFAAYEVEWQPLVKLRRDVEQVVRIIFAGCGWPEFLLVSLAAGVGEEILFRGALQPLLISWTNPWFGIVIAALLFGLAHAMSTTYFLAATVIGIYFGWLMLAYDDLVAPMVAHAFYDFVALVYVQYRAREDRNSPPAD